MGSRAAPLDAIYALNTDLLLNCVEDLTDSVASRRLEGGGNSIAFLVAHLTDARFFIAHLLGAALDNPLARVLEDATSIEDTAELPPLRELIHAWVAVSAELSRLLSETTEADLARSTPERYPVPGGTVKDALTFLAQHDSYHIGQIAFLRRQFGLSAMKYTRRSTRAAG